MEVQELLDQTPLCQAEPFQDSEAVIVSIASKMLGLHFLNSAPRIMPCSESFQPSGVHVLPINHIHICNAADHANPFACSKTLRSYLCLNPMVRSLQSA